MKISEVCEKTNFSADTLRYYERIGLIAPVARTESGIRDYQEKDIQRIKFIQCMRKAGIPLKALNDYIRLVGEGDATIEARKAILVQQRDELLNKIQEMQETLDLLNYKIKVYEERVLKAENEMILNAENDK
jgi:DNA-binding transcriptional MerR regulator